MGGSPLPRRTDPLPPRRVCARLAGVVKRFVERREVGQTGKSMSFTLPGMGRFVVLERPEHLEHIQRVRPARLLLVRAVAIVSSAALLARGQP